MRRKDIRELLGEGSPDYAGSHGRILEYGSERQLPSGVHLLFGFDEKQVVDTIVWVSEQRKSAQSSGLLLIQPC